MGLYIICYQLRCLRIFNKMYHCVKLYIVCSTLIPFFSSYYAHFCFLSFFLLDAFCLIRRQGLSTTTRPFFTICFLSYPHSFSLHLLLLLTIIIITLSQSVSQSVQGRLAELHAQAAKKDCFIFLLYEETRQEEKEVDEVKINDWYIKELKTSTLF